MQNSKQFMTSQEAIKYILNTGLAQSKYALAKMFGVQPITIDNWLKGSKMSIKIADIMTFMFDICITDIYFYRGKGVK